MILLKRHLHLKSNFRLLPMMGTIPDSSLCLFLVSLQCVFTFDNTHQCRMRRSPTCDWGVRSKKIEGVTKRWWRQDTWHFGVSRLMERSLEGVGFLGMKRERDREQRKRGGRQCWRVPVEALGFVSSPWQPLPMSYQIITLSSPRHSSLPSLRCPPPLQCSFYGPPKRPKDST